MKQDYKAIDVFIDPNNNLIIQSASYSEKYGSLSNDLITELHSPYSDEALEKALINSLNQYDSKPVDDNLNDSPLAAYYGKKSYDAVVRDKRLVSILWYIDKGYICMPTKKARRGHNFLNNKLNINLPTDFKAGELAQALRKAIDLSYIEVK